MEQQINRSERLHVLLTKEERAKLEAEAKRVGVGISVYLRMKALEAVNAAAS